MTIEAAFVSVLLASLAGLGLSVAIERILVPCPQLARPWAAWALHCGLWFLAYGLLTLILGRPWFAAAAVSAFLLVIVLVNNAKVKALHEPFVFQDYEYFTDAICHPRLYIPFFGWSRFFFAVTGFVLAIAVGLWIEEAPVRRFDLTGQLGGIATVLAASVLILMAGHWRKPGICFVPERDVCALGLLACLWRYADEERAPLEELSPFGFLPLQPHGSGLPHLVAVQSESFFDPRTLYSGIRAEVLAEFDRLKSDATAHGKLKVPAWGANTVRTEFAFLCGIGADKLGVHRFNPYRAIATGGSVPSLASYLKHLGYRTICIHPYHASFYRRNRVSPRMGFNEFIDVHAFDDSMRFGPYIGDLALADKVATVLQEAVGPVFVFVITMENHGPLHLERVEPSDFERLYSALPPEGCDDLTIYLRHLRNAGLMVDQLRHTLENCGRDASLCWFGDHVPIMPSVYEEFGCPSGDVEYVIWGNCKSNVQLERDLDAHDLAMSWLRSVEVSSQKMHSYATNGFCFAG